MRPIWFGLSIVVNGQYLHNDQGNVIDFDIFIEKYESLARKIMTTVQTKESKCDAELNNQINGTTPCFVLNVNKTEPDKFYQAIFLTEHDVKEAKNFIEEEYDEVKAIFSGNPECKIIKYDIEVLRGTQSGSKNITIQMHDAKNVNKLWKVGKTVKYSFFKANRSSGNLPITSDIFDSVVQSTYRSIGTRYSIPEPYSCTPCLQRASIICNNLSFRASYFRNNVEITDRWNHLPPTAPSHRLLPITRGNYNYFFTVNGCIDSQRDLIINPYPNSPIYD